MPCRPCVDDESEPYLLIPYWHECSKLTMEFNQPRVDTIDHILLEQSRAAEFYKNIGIHLVHGRLIFHWHFCFKTIFSL